MRESSGISLREAERRSGRGRGNLSQIETGKARPNRSLVEWYDEALKGDGLLLNMYFEARTALTQTEPPAAARPTVEPNGHDPSTDSRDVTGALQVLDTALPQGALVHPDEQIEIGWTIANVGAADWHGRSLLRIGAHAGPRLLASPPACDVPDCPSGGTTNVRLAVRAPSYEGTCVAYWEMVAGDADTSFAAVPHLSAQLVVRA